MKMSNNEDCIFCKIVKGKVPCYKIYENKKFLAILDIFPNTTGAALVLSKKHYNSDIFQMPTKEYSEIMQTTKKVVELLKKALLVERVGIIVEGMGVNHAHIKLYPMRGLGKEWKPVFAGDEVFYEKYPGFLTSATGPKAKYEDLKELSERISKLAKEIKKEK